jgi:glycosyltransferase involved in cell wall biosynthesis
MKILWFSHTADVAGAELCLLEAARGLIAAGHEIHVVLPVRGPLEDLLKRHGASVSTIAYRWWIAAGALRSPVHRARRLTRNILAWPRIRSLLARSRPDLVVSNTLDIPAGALAARSLRIPHTWYVHELYGKEGHGLFFDFGERPSLFLMDRLASRVLASSHVVQTQLRRSISPEKIRVVYQAAEVPSIAECRVQSEEWESGHSALGTRHSALGPDRPLRLVVVGRITKGKRQMDAVSALSLLAASGLDVRLTFIGSEEPDYGRSLRAMIEDLRVTDRVEFVPFTEDPYSRVAEADVGVNCSLGESFGRVTVEAMKLGKPVIGADSAGTRELIRDGWNGLLYRPADPVDLAEKITNLCRDREQLARMGRQACEWAHARFTLDRYTAALLEVFEEAVR